MYIRVYAQIHITKTMEKTIIKTLLKTGSSLRRKSSLTKKYTFRIHGNGCAQITSGEGEFFFFFFKNMARLFFFRLKFSMLKSAYVGVTHPSVHCFGTHDIYQSYNRQEAALHVSIYTCTCKRL